MLQLRYHVEVRHRPHSGDLSTSDQEDWQMAEAREEEIVITEADVDDLRPVLQAAARALQDYDDDRKIEFPELHRHLKNLFIWRPGG